MTFFVDPDGLGKRCCAAMGFMHARANALCATPSRGRMAMAVPRALPQFPHPNAAHAVGGLAIKADIRHGIGGIGSHPLGLAAARALHTHCPARP